jgi:hypothetical protein
MTANTTSNAYSSAGGTLVYRWYIEGVGAIQEQTSHQLTISNLTPADAGSYYCTVYEIVGDQASANTVSNYAVLIVNESVAVDKSKLEAAIFSYENLLNENGLPINDYTPTSWSIAKEAYNAAVLVSKDGNATQMQVDTATETLIEAIKNLQIIPNQSLDDNYRITLAALRVTDDSYLAAYNIQNYANISSEFIVIAAIYDQRGFMYASKMFPVIVDKEGQKSGEVPIAVPYGLNKNDVVMKAFIWSGTTWIPLVRDVTCES